MLGPPRYDTQRRVLSIPFRGGSPPAFSGAFDDPPRIFYDFDAAPDDALTQGIASSAGDADFLRWVMAPRDNHQLRLTLFFRTVAPNVVSFTNLRTRELELLIPGGLGPAYRGDALLTS